MAQFDLIVIGAGPGGYVAAIKAAQLGLKTACIEKEQALGGTCLRIGCIPSKALLESSDLYAQAKSQFAEHGVECGKLSLDLATMLRRKEKVVTALTGGIDGLFKKNKVTRFLGHARIVAKGEVVVETTDSREELTAKHIIIATGSSPSTLKGVEFDGDRIGTSTEALSYPGVPERLVVIGAGYIGLELGSVWNRLGSKVTVLEYLDRILPGTDGEVAAEAQKIFTKQGIEFHLKTKVTGAKIKRNKVTVEREGGDAISCDRLLVAAGRVPNTEGLNLDAVGVKRDDRGRIEVNDHFQTSIGGIYAIGDVIRGPMLAHKAEDEGLACVESIVTGYCHVNYDAIPSVAYTDPEIGAVGRTEEQLKDAGIEYRKGSFPFIANGRARALGHTEGRVKVLADAKTDRVLGVHIIGPRAGDLIAEAAVAIEFGASSEDIARSSHAHPTLAEALREAAMGVQGKPIHI